MRWTGLLCLAAAMMLAGAGCSSLEDEPDPALRELAREQHQLWDSHEIENYRFTYERVCECPSEVMEPFEVVVRQGAIDSVYIRGLVVETDNFDSIFTIDGLFDFIEQGFERGPDRTSLRFDPERNYPVRIFFDYETEIADEEDLINVTGFEER